MTKFSASTNTTVKIVTAVTVLLLVYFVAAAFLGDSKLTLIPAAILLFVIGLSYYFSITKYEVDRNQLIIRRPFDSVSISLENLQSVERIAKKDLRWTVRTFGIGGLFSYTGEFWNKKLGSMSWYVTRMDKAVMIVHGNRKIVISPDDPEKFLEALKN